MKTTGYVLPLGVDVRKRHFHIAEKGEVKGFMVQLEIMVYGKWVPVIRYDCAHNVAHIDYYNIKGEKRQEKLKLSFSEALVLADEDIKQNWEEYKSIFLRGGRI